LKKRSEQRLLEQQQQLLKHKSTNEKENNLLGDINNLRDRYKAKKEQESLSFILNSNLDYNCFEISTNKNIKPKFNK